MNPWKQLLLTGYYYATMPQRSRSGAERTRQGNWPAIVLFYHRVADHHSNPWTMSTGKFARQIQWLQANFDLVSLAEAQRRIAAGFNQRPTVSITFDDGYADNCEFALPLLLRQQIPCTYFVTTKNVLEGTPFPHDVERGAAIEPNSLPQLRELNGTCIEIGAHTRTHARLSEIEDPDRLDDEIAAARDDLSDALDREVLYFAFPYGQHDDLSIDAFQWAQEAGYDGVCSAYGGYNHPGEDPFHLQRIHADPEMIRLKNWLSVDPRKQRAVKRFQYKRRPVITSPAGVGLI